MDIKKLKYYLSVVLALFSLAASAQVSVNVKIDSLELFIGEQTTIHLEVNMNAGQRLRFPVFNDTIIRGVEVVDASKVDTVFVNDGKRISVTQDYVITSFDSALYYIPPFRVYVDEKPYDSKSLALKVLSVPVDTVHADKFFGPKDVMAAPFSWDDWKASFWASVLIFIITLLTVYAFIRYRDNKPIIKRIRLTPKLPAHKKAINRIEELKANNLVRSEDSKEYYTQLTDALRTYIYERYGFNAMEMTSSEIIAKLTEVGNKQSLNELRQLFQTSDLVKFARYSTLINENDANLVSAIDFINQTKVEEVEPQKPVEQEYTVEEKRSRRSKIILGVIVVTGVIAVLALFSYVLYNIYDLVS